MHPILPFVWLEVFLTNIDQSQPRAKDLLKKGGIAVARSFFAGALLAINNTIKETVIKFAKSTGTKILLLLWCFRLKLLVLLKIFVITLLFISPGGFARLF